MGNVAILGTKSNHGGAMITASGERINTNKGDVCILGDLHDCPIDGHGTTPIVSAGAKRVRHNGTDVAINGSKAGCGAVLNSNFANRLIIT